MHCPLPPCSLQSMWDLPGLNEKDMTREEFYKAVQVPTHVLTLLLHSWPLIH